MADFKIARKNAEYFYIDPKSLGSKSWTVYSGSSGGRFQANDKVYLSGSGGVLSLTVAFQKGPIQLSLGKNHGKYCWLFGLTELGELMFCYKAVHSGPKGNPVFDFEIFDTDGTNLEHLPWNDQICHYSLLPPIAGSNQDDEGSGEEP